MKMRGRVLAVLGAWTSATILCGAVARGQETRTAGAAASKGAPTAAEAQAFLEDAEKHYFDLSVKASRASWVQENFITDDTEQIAADANEELNTLSADLAKKAHRFDGVKLPPEMARRCCC